MSGNKQQGYECPKCKNNYSTAYSMYRHMRKVHNCDVNRCVTLYCPIENCNQSYDRYNALDSHLTHVHYADIRKETLNFADLQDFETWLKDITLSSKTKYIKRSCNNSYRYYRCHRSGLPKTSTEKISTMKSSVKIGRHCPSRIIAKITDRSVQVEFVPTHIGHDCEIAKIPLSQKKRHDIACRLATSNNNSVAASAAAAGLANDKHLPPTQQMTPLSTAATNQNATSVNNPVSHHHHQAQNNHDTSQQHLHVTQSVTGQQGPPQQPNQMQPTTNGNGVSALSTNQQTTGSSLISGDNPLMINLAPMKSSSAAGVPDQSQQLGQHQLQQRPPPQPQHISIQAQLGPQNQLTNSNMSLMSLTSPNRQELTNRFEQLMASVRSDKHASIVKAQLEVCYALIRD
uniref:C2H2-type domain-containing protein n=1 Tax=Aceria tosichella TaxID=561515 RepID=A0A6G1SJI7_9ACAR